MFRTNLARPLVALVLAVSVSACGSDTSEQATGTDPGRVDAAFPVSVAVDNGTVTIADRPEAIVSLSPSITEMIYAVGAGDQVVAVDVSSDFPAGTPMTDLSGFRPNVEAIGALEPDLVFVARDRDGIVSTLENVGIPVVLLEAADTLAEVYRQIELVGVATGHETRGIEVADTVEAEIVALQARVVDRPEPMTYYYELTDDYGTVTSNTFVGSVFSLAGMVNIADGVDPAAGNYPKLTAEYVLGADPDYIFLGHGSGPVPSLAEIAARPGWAGLSAVAGGRVIGLEADLASRWGPRVVELFETVIRATEQVG